MSEARMGVGALVFLLIFVSLSSEVKAHPGRTASDECHYCRTNCDKWGEVWNARHCHGGGTSSNTYSVSTSTPYYTSTPIPTIPYYTSTPWPTSTSISTSTSRPTNTTQVKAVSTEFETAVPSQTIKSDEEVDLSTSDWILGLGFMGIMVATPVYLVKKIIGKLR